MTCQSTLGRLLPLALVAALALTAPATAAALRTTAEYTLDCGAQRLTFSTNGVLVRWAGLADQVDAAQSSVAGELHYGNRTLRLDSPQVSSAAGLLVCRFHWAAEPGLAVTIRHHVRGDRGAVVWTRDVEIRNEAKLASDLTVSLQSWPAPMPSTTWLPLLDGTGTTLGTNEAAGYRFAGLLPSPGAPLSLPMVSVPGQREGRRLLIATDPYFSTCFKPTRVEWTYLAKASLPNGCETRSVVVAAHQGSVEDALSNFYRLLLPNIAPGPEWLHNIALVDFDYLSDEGEGWFRDIDALTLALPKRERRQVFLCLHGWYDFLGRYCFDARTGKLDQEWTAFSNWESARKAHPLGTIGGEQVEMGFANCKPKKMSLAEVHRRLQYARSRGFRAGLYFADGLNAGDGLADFDPSRVLQWGGWQGPDSKGRSYLQNPLNPQVRAFYLDYAKALLAEFGEETDALVWDETFHVPCGQLGTDAWPGYADRAMMRLTQEITALVDDYNRGHRRHIAFLTSDCLGAFGSELKGPYALVSHGTYQDSWCQPKAWSYGVFANYRNVLWSCCWWYVTKWAWVDFGVRQYQAPVSISNGWGNDKGFSELTAAQQARVLELFNWRKKQPTRLKWLPQLPAPPSAPGSL